MHKQLNTIWRNYSYQMFSYELSRGDHIMNHGRTTLAATSRLARRNELTWDLFYGVPSYVNMKKVRRTLSARGTPTSMPVARVRQGPYTHNSETIISVCTIPEFESSNPAPQQKSRCKLTIRDNLTSQEIDDR